MVGDSLLHDVIGARGAGMRGILLARGSRPDAAIDVDARTHASDPGHSIAGRAAECPVSCATSATSTVAGPWSTFKWRCGDAMRKSSRPPLLIASAKRGGHSHRRL